MTEHDEIVVHFIESLRTVHLERLGHRRETILYSRESYDFDPIAAGQLTLIRVNGVADLFRRLWTLRPAVLELSEPFYVRGLPAVLAAQVLSMAWRLRGLPRLRIVTYAIDNLPPGESREFRILPVRLRRPIARAVFRLALLRFDRIAFGTEAARANYLPLLRRGERSPETRLFSALAPRCPCAEGAMKRGQSLIFLGAFDERKGISQILEAWPRVSARLPEATLTVLGKGKLEAEVLRRVGDLERVSLTIDPSRSQIHAELRVAKVLVLLPQPVGYWREQIGLPLVEGASHGCLLVTNDQSGLAPTLRSMGHVVVDDDNVADLEDALVLSLLDRLNAGALEARLPLSDGRAEADAWMISRHNER